MPASKKSSQARASFKKGGVSVVHKYAERLCSKLGAATIIFVVIALFFGVIIASEVPAFWALDESSHFSRAYQISGGHLLPEKLPDTNYGGSVPVGVIKLNDSVHQDLSNLYLGGQTVDRHDAKHLDTQKAIERQKINGIRENLEFPGAAVYSPVAYAAPSSGILACRLLDCSLGQTILIARLCSLLAYVVVTGAGIYLLRASKLKWLLFMVALLPITLFQAASVSADGPAISLSFLLFAVVIKTVLDRKLSRPWIYIALFTALLLPLVKVSYGILDLSLIPAATILIKDKKKALAYSAIFALGAVLIVGGWTYLARGAARDISTLHASNPAAHIYVSGSQQSSYLLHKPMSFIGATGHTVVLDEAFWVYSTVGEFALNGVQMPLSAIVFAYMLLAALTFYARDELSRHRKTMTALGVISIVSALGVFMSLYLTFTVVGKNSVEGVQGRYFLPLLPFLMVAIGALAPIKTVMSTKTAAILCTTSACLLLTLGLVYYGLATY